MRKAGMELRKWRGNAFIDDSVTAEEVLGLEWDTDRDHIQLCKVSKDVTDVSDVPEKKRQLLQAAASIFDPLGLACPIIIVGKILLQTAWRQGGGWDQAMGADIIKQAAEWWGEIRKLKGETVERWIGSTPDSSYTLHCFCDASEQAYGCCIYLVSGSESHLIYAKSKVAPVKQQSLARMELQAAFLASSCLEGLYGALRTTIQEVVCWTDSLTTWHWVQKPPHCWKTWVANRVAAVQEISRKRNARWLHCPGVENPADIASRGASLVKLLESSWFSGPKWLLHKEAWPEQQVVEETVCSSATVLDVKGLGKSKTR